MSYVANDYVPVRDFTSVAAMQAHYKRLRERTFAPPPPPVVVHPQIEAPAPPPAPLARQDEQPADPAEAAWTDYRKQARETVEKTQNDRKKPPAKKLIAEASEILGYLYDAIVGPRRIQKLAWARQDVMLYVAERRPDLSLPALGRLFGGGTTRPRSTPSASLGGGPSRSQSAAPAARLRARRCGRGRRVSE